MPPSAINGSIPVAGTALAAGPLATNFNTAKTEISDLQSGKQDTLVSGTNIRTVNGHSLLGSTDLVIAPGGTGTVTSIGVGSGLTGGPTITTTGTISLSTPVTVANGGTGAGTGASALDSLSGASGATAGVLSRAAGGTWSIAAAGGGGTVTSIATTAPIGGGPITGSGTITHANSGVTAGTYQGLVVNAMGHVTSASNMNYALQSALTALEARVSALESAGPGPTPSAPVITSSNTATGTVGQSFSYTMSATGFPTPTLTATGLPGWLTQSGNVVSGTPPVGSDSTGATFTVQASNSEGSPTLMVNVTIAPAVGGFTITYSFPNWTTFDFSGNGKIALSSWTSWNAGTMQSTFTDASLYGPPPPANMAALPVKMYATYSGQSEVLVDFDLWPGTPAGNKITNWGLDSTDNTVYIEGSNATGQPIQLRLVKA